MLKRLILIASIIAVPGAEAANSYKLEFHPMTPMTTKSNNAQLQISQPPQSDSAQPTINQQKRQSDLIEQQNQIMRQQQMLDNSRRSRASSY